MVATLRLIVESVCSGLYLTATLSGWRAEKGDGHEWHCRRSKRHWHKLLSFKEQKGGEQNKEAEKEGRT
jgi:hypothetical protein